MRPAAGRERPHGVSIAQDEENGDQADLLNGTHEENGDSMDAEYENAEGEAW